MQDVQIHQKSVRPKRPLNSWFDVRSRKVGSWAFALNRLTGLGLTFYLIVHLGILTILLQGEQAWDDFVLIVKSPFFLVMDVVLLFGLLFHGLNGIRVALVGMGIGVKNQKTLFWVLMVVGIVLLVVGASLIFVL